MPYPIPPWLRPPEDPASTFLQAAHAGAAIATERERLTLSEQVAEREALRDRQQMEIDKARHAAEMGLKKRELDQAEQQIKLQVQTAARRTQAQQKYQQLMASGVEAAKAAMIVGPSLFSESGTGFGSAARAASTERAKWAFVPGQGEMPATFQAPGQRPVVVPRAPVPQSITAAERARISMLMRQRDQLSKSSILDFNPETWKDEKTKAIGIKKKDEVKAALKKIDDELARLPELRPPQSEPAGGSSSGLKRLGTYDPETGEFTQSQSEEEE